MEDLSNEVIIIILRKVDIKTLMNIRMLNMRFRNLVSVSYNKINIINPIIKKINNIKYAKCVEGDMLGYQSYLNGRVKHSDYILINGFTEFIHKINKFNKILINSIYHDKQLKELISYGKPITFLRDNWVSLTILCKCYHLLKDCVIYKNNAPFYKNNKTFCITYKTEIKKISLYNNDIIEISGPLTRDSLTRDSSRPDGTYRLYDLEYTLSRSYIDDICIITKSYKTDEDLYIDENNNIYSSIISSTDIPEYKMYSKYVFFKTISYNDLLKFKFTNIEVIKTSNSKVKMIDIDNLFYTYKTLKLIRLEEISFYPNFLIGSRLYDVYIDGGYYPSVRIYRKHNIS